MRPARLYFESHAARESLWVWDPCSKGYFSICFSIRRTWKAEVLYFLYFLSDCDISLQNPAAFYRGSWIMTFLVKITFLYISCFQSNRYSWISVEVCKRKHKTHSPMFNFYCKDVPRYLQGYCVWKFEPVDIPKASC